MWGNRENKLLRRALAMYAGDQVLSRVLSEGERFLAPKARTVELTMLFYDVASITPHPELDPQSLGAWGLALAEAATSAVARTAGTFDMFIGDAGSAWWGEGEDPRHAERAIEGASQLVVAIAQLNDRAQTERFPKTELMIGVHTGKVALGNWGSKSRLRYCPMGDAVNVTSRLCKIAQKHRVPIALSEATHGRLANTSHARHLETVTVTSGAPMAIYGIDGR